MTKYFHKLEPLIKCPDLNLSINIITVPADLEIRLKNIFEDFKSVKKLVSNFAKGDLKGETINELFLKKYLDSKPEFELFAPLYSFMDAPDFTEEELDHFCYNSDETHNKVL